MYVANTANLELRFFCEKYHLRLWVFASTGAYKSYVCILQIASFEKKCCLVLYIIGSDKKDVKLYLLDPLHLQRANELFKIKPVNTQSRSSMDVNKKNIC